MKKSCDKMKIAYIILCHKSPNQINRMIETLDNDDSEFYLHIDKKSNIGDEIIKKDTVHIIPKGKRIDVKWGQISQVYSTLLLIDEVIKSKKKYDYVWLISGQDFPIKTKNEIVDFLTRGNGSNYINIMDVNNNLYKRFLKRNTLLYPKWIVNNKFWIKVVQKLYILITGGTTRTLFAKRRNTTGMSFHFGSQWWALTYECVCYLNDYVNKNPNVLNFYENTVCPDESFFQTIFMNSKFKGTQKDYLTFVDWSENKRSPKTFKMNDFNTLFNNDFLIARKFDEDVDSEIIEAIYKKVTKK